MKTTTQQIAALLRDSLTDVARENLVDDMIGLAVDLDAVVEREPDWGKRRQAENRRAVLSNLISRLHDG